VPQARFAQQCDRLSEVVDKTLFERLRWERTEAPILAKLVALAHASLEAREEFELTEEGATPSVKRFVLKIHSTRVAALTLCLADGKAELAIHSIERSPYRVAPGATLCIPFAGIDEAWMAASLDELFARIGN
jgi:hypothetical protein